MVALTASAGLASPAAAEYPEQPVRIIVPYSPGGSTDAVFRIVAESLERELGQRVVIVNVQGAGGGIGMLEAVQAEPDGYTLGVYNTNSEILQAVGSAEFTTEQMQPVALLGDTILAVTVRGDSSYETIGDFREAAQANPGELSVAMGHGNLAHFVAVLFAEGLEGDVRLVNVGSGAEKKAAVLGGHLTAMIEPTTTVIGEHREGELRILAVFHDERLENLPDVPTAQEFGIDVTLPQTLGVFVPQGTPEDRVQILADAIGRIADDEEAMERLERLDLVWNYMPPAEFEAYRQEIREAVFSVKEKAGF